MKTKASYTYIFTFICFFWGSHLLSAQSAQASPANCDCDYIINPTLANGISFAPWRTGSYYFNPPPGSVVCLKGIYQDLRIDGIMGTLDSPIIFKNYCDSVAQFISTTSNPPFSLTNSKYVHITGTATPSVEYGIVVDCNGSAGISVSGTIVRDIEIDHVEIKKTNFAGFMVKQDPTCDPNTWLNNTTYYNIDLHHNYVHDVIGEGFYIGNSFWQGGMNRTCNNQTITVYPHRIYGLKIHHNIVKNTGWDGIQYGCSPDANVYNNLIENTGLLKVSQQTNGVQIGGGSGGHFYNNIIRNPGSTALAIIGFSDTVRVYNNLIANAYEGIFADTRDSISAPKIELQIYNNTLINTSQNGMTIYDNGYQYKNASNQWVFFPKGYQPRVKNNVIIGAYFDFRLLLRNPLITLDSTNNYKLRTPFSSPPQYFASQKLQLFADTFAYTLKENSYLIDRGTNTVSSVVSSDLLSVPRPQGFFHDIGAYEYFFTSVPQAFEKSQNMAVSQNFSIYPTLVKDVLNIRIKEIGEDAEIHIYDITGRIHALKSLKDKQTTLDLGHLKQGLYICTLINGNSLQSIKFIKQ